MRECPRRFDHPSEAVCLSGIGPAIAKWLEEKMQEHCLKNGIPYDNRRRSWSTAPSYPKSANNE
jgi:crossover junction endonuclease MUS81